LPSPRLPPRWMTWLGGSAAALLSRSQRMSNAKLKRATGWSPRWKSAREGLADSLRGAR
jgi:nucleoside-diphosphate-sugar epimerase